MASQEQTNANRRNARRSTGPKTPRGRYHARMNARKHGLRGHEVLLPDEDREEFEEFRENFFRDLRPAGFLESELTDQIVSSRWWLRRCERMGAGRSQPSVGTDAISGRPSSGGPASSHLISGSRGNACSTRWPAIPPKDTSTRLCSALTPKAAQSSVRRGVPVRASVPVVRRCGNQLIGMLGSGSKNRSACL